MAMYKNMPMPKRKAVKEEEPVVEMELEMDEDMPEAEGPEMPQYKIGDISSDEMIAELKKRGDLPEDFGVEDEMEDEIAPPVNVTGKQ